MAKLKNKVNAPTTISIDSEKSLHFSPYEQIEVTKQQLQSPYVQAAINSGRIKLIEPIEKEKGAE